MAYYFMPDVSRSGSALVSPSGYALNDYELGKFVVENGTASVRITGSGLNGTAGTAGAVPVVEQYAPVSEDNTAGVAGVNQKPVASSTYAPSEHLNAGAAAGTGVLIKASAGNVYSFDVTSATTALRYFQLFNQGTVPVLGQTPVASYVLGSVPAGGVFRLQVSSADLAPSRYFATGIAAAISSTQGTLGTASITAADYSWHIKYV